MTRVDIYRNLHKGCWSIRDAKTRLVIGHAETVSLLDVEFRVSEAGRQRVLREKRKNVHAYVRGTLTDEFEEDDFHVVSYNPYKAASFVMAPFNSPVHSAERALLTDTGKVWVNRPKTL